MKIFDNNYLGHNFTVVYFNSEIKTLSCDKCNCCAYFSTDKTLIYNGESDNYYFWCDDISYYKRLISCNEIIIKQIIE